MPTNSLYPDATTRNKVADMLRNTLQGASNAAASNVSAPVDGIAWLLRKAGVPVGDAPFGGSDWMRQNGLTADAPGAGGLLGETVGGIAPIMAVAKAPQIAQGLLTTANFSPRQAMYGARVGEWTPTRLADWEVAAKLRERIGKDFDSYVARYSARPDAEGGKVLNTDVARELSPYYMADRTRSAAVHEPASQFIKDLYARKLAEAPSDGQAPVVMFTAGGTGAGKSSAIKNVPDVADKARTAQIIYDTNMSTLDSAKKKIDQALAAGKGASVAMVVRDPVDALVNGALPRAERQLKTFGSGRTVPLYEHQKTHTGAIDSVRRLATEYADNPRVNFDVVDNSLGLGKAVQKPIDWLDSIQYNDLERRLRAALEAEREASRISEATYRGFAGPKK